MSHDERIINHERRIEHVEQEVNLLTHQANLTTNLIGRLEKQLEKFDTLTRNLELTLAKRTDCPAPGECLKIRDDLVQVSKRVASIETERNKFVGMLIVIGVVATSLWGLVSAWISNLLKH